MAGFVPPLGARHGATWDPQTSGTDQSLMAVQFLDAQTGWAVGYDGHIIATRNSGVTWSNQETGIHDELNAIAFADATHGWAVGEGGTILRTVVPATDVAGGQAGLPTRGAVLPRLTSAPNPFSAGTTIRYELAQAERVSVAVFDAQGRRVRRIESGRRSAGEWQAVWDSRDEEGRPVT